MKKQRLNENEVRKLMKFANLGTLTNGFVDKLNETELWEADEEEEELPGDLGGGGEDLDMDMGAEEAPVEDPEAAEDMDLEGGGDSEDLLKDLFSAMVKGVVEEHPELEGVVSVEEEGEEALDDLDPMPGEEDEAAMEPSPEVGGEEALPGEEEEGDELGALEEAEIDLEDDNEEEMVNEVARRVARRLLNGKIDA